MKCAYCEEEIITPVTVEKEITTCRDGIDMDVPVIKEYCSEECKDEDQHVCNVLKLISHDTNIP